MCLNKKNAYEEFKIGNSIEIFLLFWQKLIRMFQGKGSNLSIIQQVFIGEG
jgi:hypothetical protein